MGKTPGRPETKKARRARNRASNPPPRSVPGSPMDKIRRGICLACDSPGPHFVPPGMGMIGFYTCQPVPEDLTNHSRFRPTDEDRIFIRALQEGKIPSPDQ